MLFILAMDPLQKLLNMATMEGLLPPIEADPVKLRTSLYADDAALFLRPIADDVSNLKHILLHFGMATGLCTNIQKTEMILIQCEALDVKGMLGQFQARITDLPCKYLGLSLFLGRTKQEDEQILVDKVTAKLPSWKGRLLNKVGRLTLVNSVLTSTIIYYMIVFPLSKWAIKRIERIGRNFLWNGAEEARSGHCLVNWKWVQHCKNLGGLNILELERFKRALRLIWQWLHWKQPSKLWSSLQPHHLHAEEQLFRACTRISLGNGLSTKFWHDSWLQG
jgi:hypothetical protein